MEENTLHVKESRSYLERIAMVVIMAIAFLVPLFFIPGGVLSLVLGKMLIIYIGTCIALILFMLSVLEKGRIDLPRSPIFYVAALIPVLFLVSSLFSKSVAASLVGYGFEIGSFAFILIMFVFLFLVSSLYRSKEKIFYSYLLFFISFGIIALYQLLKIMFPNALTFGGVFNGTIANVIGGWNDLGIFFGASALLALVTLEMLTLSKFFKILIYIAFVISLVFLAIVNFSTLWIILALFSLVFFVYMLSSRTFHRGGEEGTISAKKRISYRSLALLAISIVFIVGGTAIGGLIFKATAISNLEVRPSWSTTWTIAQHTLRENALLGSGPNSFALQWMRWKPEGVNISAFWNTDFNYGIGLIPTFLVTTGILGALVWLGFIIAYLYVGVRAIFGKIANPLSRFLLISSFIVSLFLWIVAIVYVPSAVILTLTFFFTGLFIAAAYSEKLIATRHIALYENARVGFVAVLTIVFVIIASIGGGYYIIRNLTSAVHFQKGVLFSSSQETIPQAMASIQKAASLSGHDIYYRTLTELDMYRVNQVLNKTGTPVEALRTEFQAALSAAIEDAMNAVKSNPTNYENYLLLGQVYESVVAPPLAIEGAYEKAKDAYVHALELNPTNPQINLLLARLEITHQSIDTARPYVEKSLQLKSNYVDAYFLLSQVEVAAGNTTKAISSVESATMLAPDNAGIYFQLGLLKYNIADWEGARVAFERAITIVPTYANAKYFLGISYSKLGRSADAVKQFEDLKITNPDNAEVATILDNLKVDRDPFAGLIPPLDNKPEKRENPPITE